MHPISSGCFLCQPDVALVYHESTNGRAISGLGPLVPGYSVVASRGHIPSAADALHEGAADFLTFVTQVRAGLEREFGTAIMTEHGRVPVCTDNTRELHCYHAHFLMFPGAPSIIDAAVDKYRSQSHFVSLTSALESISEDEEYLLISESASSFTVMSEPRRSYRQFARTLIAEAIGTPDFASWRLRPAVEEARTSATKLRELFGRG